MTIKKLIEETRGAVFYFPLALTLVFIPWQDGGYDHPVVYGSVLLLLAGAFYYTAREKWVFVPDFTHPLTWYLLLVIWAGLSVAWSLNTHRTLVEFMELTCYGLVFLLVAMLKQDKLYRLGLITWWAGVGAACYGILQYMVLAETTGQGRVFGTFTNPNPFAVYLAMLFLLGWAYYLRRPGRLVAAGSLLLIVALLFTGSRGAFIATALALPLLFIGFDKTVFFKKTGHTLLIIIIALLVVQALMITAPLVQAVFATDQAGEIGNDELTSFITRSHSFIPMSVAGRLSFWKVAGNLTFLEPLKGHGLGSYYTAYFLAHPGDMWFSRFAHNHYLQTLAELGLIGFSLLSMFILSTLRLALRRLKSESYPFYYPGLFGALAVFLLHICMDFSFNFPGATVIFFAAAGGMTGRPPIHFGSIKGVLYLPRVAIQALILILFIFTYWQYSSIINFGRGEQLYQAEQFEEAAVVLEKTISTYPFNALFYSRSADNYRALGQKRTDPELLAKEALMLEKAIQHNPVSSTLHNKLGLVYQKEGNIKKAEKHLVMAVDYAGYRIGRHLDLGVFYEQEGRVAEAEKVYFKALALETVVIERIQSWEPGLEEDLLQLYQALAALYNRRGEKEQALEFEAKADRLTQPLNKED